MEKKYSLYLIVLLSMLSICILSCSSAIGIRNPNYSKKIENIGLLQFSGPAELAAQATSVFHAEIKRITKVRIYQAYQMKEFLQENGLPDIKLTDAAARKILQDKLGIDALLSGQIVQYNNTARTAGNIETTVWLTDIEDNKQIYSASVRSDDAGILSGENYEIIEANMDAIVSDIKSQFNL
jgi:hypothetical protein